MNEKHKRLVLIGMMIFSVLPIFVLLPLPALATLKAWALYGSALVGYIGVVMLLWMYIIGTRATSRLFFADTAPVLHIHRLLGTYGAIFILLHPLLVIYNYGESLLYSILPSVGTVFDRHVTLGRIAFLLFATIWVSSALLRKRMAYRPWKYLHYLAYICLPFALLHVPNVGSAFMNSLAIKLYYFTIVIAALIFTLLRLQSLFNLNRYRYTVTRQDKLMEDTLIMTLKPIDQWITPKRGQYIYLKLGLVSEDHPFSVVQYDDQSHEITIAYRVFGTFTDALRDIKVGDTISVDGPYGAFTAEVTADDKPSVFIAGGIGVTPFVDHILRGDERERWLFYASPSEPRATLLPVLRDELGDRCVPIYSQQRSPGDEYGYIDADIIRRHLKDPTAYNYFICGPQGMMENSEMLLVSLGIAKKQIFTEKFEF